MGSQMNIGEGTMKTLSGQVSGRGRMQTMVVRNSSTERKKSCFVNGTTTDGPKKSIDLSTPNKVEDTGAPALGGMNDKSGSNAEPIKRPTDETWVGGINIDRILAFREEAYQKKICERLVQTKKDDDGGIGDGDINIKVDGKKSGDSSSVSSMNSSEMKPGMATGPKNAEDLTEGIEECGDGGIGQIKISEYKGK